MSENVFVLSIFCLRIIYHYNSLQTHIFIFIVTITIPQGSITILCIHPCGHLAMQHLTITFGHMIYMT